MSFRPIRVGKDANLYDWQGWVMTGARRWSAPLAYEMSAGSVQRALEEDRTHVACIFPPVYSPDGIIWPCIVQIATDPNGGDDDAGETD